MPIQRYSAQRERIYEAVCFTDSHPTAEMVYEALKPSMPRLSLGTVYRNLQQMAEEGRLKRLEGAAVRFDAHVEPHSHLRCLRCGAVVDLPVPYDGALDQTAKQRGFQIERHELLFLGICPACVGKDKE